VHTRCSYGPLSLLMPGGGWGRGSQCAEDSSGYGATGCTIFVPTDESEAYFLLVAAFVAEWQPVCEVEQRPFSRWFTPNGASCTPIRHFRSDYAAITLTRPLRVFAVRGALSAGIHHACSFKATASMRRARNNLVLTSGILAFIRFAVSRTVSCSRSQRTRTSLYLRGSFWTAVRTRKRASRRAKV
jgi:hypothetical protein